MKNWSNANTTYHYCKSFNQCNSSVNFGHDSYVGYIRLSDTFEITFNRFAFANAFVSHLRRLEIYNPMIQHRDLDSSTKFPSTSENGSFHSHQSAQRIPCELIK